MNSIKIKETLILEKQIGAKLSEHNIKIDLTNPKNILRCYLTQTKDLMGLEIYNSKQDKTTTIKERRPDLRPYHKPISLNPKLAKCLINLSRSKAGTSLLDPFVGTGGILIEGGFMKCRLFGLDIDPEMIEGTKQNLDFYKLKSYRINVGDAFDIRSIYSHTFDSIVTDLPYNKNTKGNNTQTYQIAQKFTDFIPSLININSYAVIASNLDNIEIPKTLELTFKYEIIIHKSLSKFIYVLKKK
jgi:tRNA (guanine10-N2)-dimethyltransferase